MQSASLNISEYIPIVFNCYSTVVSAECAQCKHEMRFGQLCLAPARTMGIWVPEILMRIDRDRSQLKSPASGREKRMGDVRRRNVRCETLRILSLTTTSFSIGSFPAIDKIWRHAVKSIVKEEQVHRSSVKILRIRGANRSPSSQRCLLPPRLFSSLFHRGKLIFSRSFAFSLHRRPLLQKMHDY